MLVSGTCVEYIHRGRNSNVLKYLPSILIYGVELGLIKNKKIKKNCSGRILAIAFDISSYTGSKQFFPAIMVVFRVSKEWYMQKFDKVRIKVNAGYSM